MFASQPTTTTVMQRFRPGMSRVRKGRLSLTLLVIVASILAVSLCNLVLSDDRIIVDIDKLPDPLKYTTFPESQGKPGEDYCTYYLGCVKVQDNKLPSLAVTIRTEFFVYSRTVTRHLIPYTEDTINCLQDDICRAYPYDLNLLLKSGIDFKKKIVIITSGFHSKVLTDWQLEMSKMWVDAEDVVVIIVAWPGGNSKEKMIIDYDGAVANTRIVARQISSLLYYLGKLNGNIEITQAPQITQNIHLIGHSLGAHISGFVGKDFEGHVGRITGLDPAGPLFETKARVMKLDRRDAQLVECYHSNGGPRIEVKFGHKLPLCHLDYYVNGGVDQPGCERWFRIGCSHKMINDLFIDLMKAQAETAVCSADDKSKSFGMFYAFVGDSYDNFRFGKSFSDHCPKFAMPESNQDLIEPTDFDNCAFPIDLLSPFNKYKSLLENKYNHLVNLNSDEDPKNKTYFQSFGPKRSEPILLRAKYPQLDNNTKNQVTYDATNFEITLQPTSYGDKSHKIKFQKYDLQPNVASGSVSFNLLVPMQIPAPTYVITQFINSQYYIDQNDDYKMLRSIVASVFPVQLQLKNLAKPASPNFVSLTRSLTLSFLRKTNRSILIAYSNERREGDLAEVHIMKSAADEIPNMNIDCDDAQARELNLYIDKIIIGPPRVAKQI